jgi:hypothetical protein
VQVYGGKLRVLTWMKPSSERVWIALGARPQHLAPRRQEAKNGRSRRPVQRPPTSRLCDSASPRASERVPDPSEIHSRLVPCSVAHRCARTQCPG